MFYNGYNIISHSINALIDDLAAPHEDMETNALLLETWAAQWLTCWGSDAGLHGGRGMVTLGNPAVMWEIQLPWGCHGGETVVTVPPKPNLSSIPRNMSGVVLALQSNPSTSGAPISDLSASDHRARGRKLTQPSPVQIPVSQNLLDRTKWFHFMLLSFGVICYTAIIFGTLSLWLLHASYCKTPRN